MCFSPEADAASAIVIGAAAVDSLRSVRHRNELPLASLPALFAAHSAMSAFVWLGIEGAVPPSVRDAAAWMFMLVAFSVLPAWVPWAVWSIEPPSVQRRRIALLALLGTVVCGVFFVRIVSGTGHASDGGNFIRYRVHASDNDVLAVAYVTATCGAMLLSGDRILLIYGVVNAIAVALLAALLAAGFASLWCFWAAITSILIALYMRRRNALTDMVATGPASNPAIQH